LLVRLALKDAMQDILAGWQADLAPIWLPAAAAVLDFDAIDPELTLEAWEPVFPARRGRTFPGAPKGAHIFHAFDGISPSDVRCVVLGQDPYPCGAFSTGRAFEAGNVASWRELEKMFSVSVRTFMQLIVAARTGNASYAASTKEWVRIRDEIESKELALEPAAEIADRWVRQGVLLLNSSLTISRFAVEGDPHQLRGHLPLWRPFIVSVLRHLAEQGTPAVFVGFGDQAAAALRCAGISASGDGAVAGLGTIGLILREHPAKGDRVLALENPFTLCNRLLVEMGAGPVSW
jgi:uracil-DNA glycosylase